MSNMEAQEGEKLHGCINCDISFKLKGNLKAHMETVHGSISVVHEGQKNHTIVLFVIRTLHKKIL